MGNFRETFGNFLETVVVVIGQESVCVGMWSHLSLYYIWFRQNTVCYCVFDYYLKERFKSLDIRNILENYDGGCIRQFWAFSTLLLTSCVLHFKMYFSCRCSINRYYVLSCTKMVPVCNTSPHKFIFQNKFFWLLTQ